MKRCGIVLVILLVALSACVLAACGEIAVTEKKATHLTFDNPYSTTTSLSPVYVAGEGMDAEENDFQLENVKLRVVYSDGSESAEIPLAESMLAPENTGNFLDGTGWQTFTVQYTVDGITVKGTFRVYTKVRTAADLATLTLVTNGGTPNTFIKKITKGSVYTTYTQFTSSFAQVTKAGYTLLGWVILPQDFDYTTKTADEINSKANALAAVNIYSSTAWPTDIDVTRDMAFCAVWQENTTKVTYNYNFAYFGISQDLYTDSGLPITQTILCAPNSTLTRPVIADGAVPGWKFDGWYTDPELTSVRSFNQQVGGTDINLYAKWEQVFYSITFNLVGGALNSDYYIVADDGKIYEKTNPSQTASSTLLKGEVAKYDSTGAVSRISYTNISYKKTLNSATTIYYLARTISTIDTNHYLCKGYYYNQDTATSGYYYNFLGWYEDSDYKTQYVFTASSTMPARNLVLYAKWDIDGDLAKVYYENYLFKDNYIVKADGTVKITGVNDKDVVKIALPNQIGGKFITEIGDDAFANCVLLSSFSIGQTSFLTTIGARAFRFCSKLTKVNVVLDNGTEEDICNTQVNLKVTSVGKDAFRGTTWLSAHDSTWITVGKVLVKYNGPESVQKIVATVSEIPSEQRDGLGDDDVVYVAYSDDLAKVDTICADAFKGLSRLTHITVPSSIVKIENDAFAGCNALASIDVLEKQGGGYALKEVGGSSFSETAWFKYPSSADNNFTQYNALILGCIYYRYAGSKNDSTTMATIPAGITIIAPDAFQDFSNIRSISFAEKTAIAEVGDNAFNDTTWYTSQGNANDGFIIVNGIIVGYIGTGEKVTAADGLSDIVAVYIPDRDSDGVAVTTISTNAFFGYYADLINAISMPETVTLIEPYAFRGATNLTVLSYIGSAKLHLYDGESVSNSLPVISETSFCGATSGVLVNSDLTIFLNAETGSSGSSLYGIATTDTSSLYYKMYSANNSVISTLVNNGIRVKGGTLPTRYVSNLGWSLNGYWNTNDTFGEDNPNRAMLVIMRSDGLPYETPLLRSYIDDSSVDSSLTSNSTPHTLEINFSGFNCQFEYYVEPKISSITVDNGVSENSLMSQAVYYTTSTRFVYAGGYLTVNYEDSAIEPLKIALNDNVGTARRIQISGFSVIKTGDAEVKFTFNTLMQSVSCNYAYTVNEPKDVGIEFYEPVKLNINSVVDLSTVVLKIIRNDIADGGQIFDVGGSGYAFYYVTMKNAKVRFVTVDGVAATEFDTSTYGTHSVVLKYGSDALGYTSEITLGYEVILKTDDYWFTYDVLSTTSDVWQVVDGVNIYSGTAKITGIQSGHYATVVVPEYFITTINDVKYRLDVVEIGASAFENDSALETVYIPATVTKLNDKAFMNCANLSSVTFMLEAAKTNLTAIGNRVFEGCSALGSVTIPSSVTDIGNYAFKGSGLTSIDLSSTGVTEISENTFEYCLSLASVSLPANLTVVGNNAFYGCSALASVTLGVNVEFIGAYAFNYCTALTSVTINATVVPTIGADAFGVPGDSLSIYVPAASLSLYTDAWTSYASRIFAA